MRWRPVVMTAAAVLGTAFLTGAGAATGSLPPAAAGTAVGAAAQGGTWGTAAEIPGSNRLNHGGQATIGTVSCASATNCGAGGSYTSGFSSTAPVVQAFVVNKTANIWRMVEEVPGTAALNTGETRRSIRCRAPRRATAAPAGTTPMPPPATSRRSSSPKPAEPGATPRRSPGPPH